ncbi:flagellar basal body-associated FliL family protein [Clostridium senegalense]|uniref:flagellar basal body-associated FliL family protein n=1 Tax=Clostridium senegalense TaxID=1465809 RepID=UPI001C0FB34F|nr:flagellar basal body-associated FliL family protein [Clostridium senegalense]MBU5225374.1 flagellar basal body-associated FliL family protein [Clostridium senegalense]
MAKEKNKKENIEGSENKKSNVLKVVLIILLFLILAGGCMFAGYFFGTKDDVPVSGNGQQVISNNSLKNEGYYDLDEFLVNLADEGKPRYLKIKISLGYDEKNKDLLPEIEKKKSAIRDSITNTLRTKKTTDLSPEGEEQLKDELITRINELLSTGQLYNVYFSEILVQ